MGHTTFFFNEVNRIISLVRRLSQAPIVLGGTGSNIFPEAILSASEADIGIEGEGEAVFGMVLNRLERQQGLEGLPGVHVKGRGLMGERALIRKPGDFPFPGPDMLIGKANGTDLWVPGRTRRGCPCHVFLKLDKSLFFV